MNVDRRGGRWEWVARWLSRYGLPIWFAAWSIANVGLLLLYEFPVGLDARIYHAAAVAWLNGGDPWNAQASVYYFSGLPPTVLAFVPFAPLPEAAFTVVWLAITFFAGIHIVRALRLPWWWLLFPPLAEGFFSGNPQVVILALLLTARGAFLAPVLKVYAFAPIVGERRWRTLLAGLVVIVASVVVAPSLWAIYVGEFTRISDYLYQQANGGFSAYYHPLLLVPALVALAILALVDLRAAGWLAVIAVWPSTQFHYSTFAMPLMSDRTSARARESWVASPGMALAVFAAALAVPVRGLPAVAVIGFAAWRTWTWWRERTARGAAAWGTRHGDPTASTL
jgi:hypothetical protein